MKDVLGDMLLSDKTMSKMVLIIFYVNYQSYKQFEKVLETVEDGDDVAATKNATKEQEDMVLEDIKFDTNPSKGLEDTENPQIDRNMLPPLYNYGLDFTEYYYGKDINDGLDIEEQENEENQKYGNEENGQQEEDFDFAPNFNQDSDEEDNNKTMVQQFYFLKFQGKKQAKKAYQDTKKLIVQNYFLQF